MVLSPRADRLRSHSASAKRAANPAASTPVRGDLLGDRLQPDDLVRAGRR